MKGNQSGAVPLGVVVSLARPFT